MSIRKRDHPGCCAFIAIQSGLLSRTHTLWPRFATKRRGWSDHASDHGGIDLFHRT
jgi:hypothetical protein